MSQLSITVFGHLTHNPQLVKFNDDTMKTNLRVASSRRVRDNSTQSTDTWKDSDLLFMDVEVWGQLAQSCRITLQKGMPIIAVGSLVTSQWATESGEARSRIYLKASWLGLDMNRWVIGARKIETVTNAAGVEIPGESVLDYPVDKDLSKSAPQQPEPAQAAESAESGDDSNGEGDTATDTAGDRAAASARSVLS